MIKFSAVFVVYFLCGSRATVFVSSAIFVPLIKKKKLFEEFIGKFCVKNEINRNKVRGKR